jgi:hypothetical protein
MEEAPGVPSSVRLQMLIVCAMAGVLPLSVWAFVSVSRGELADIPGGVVSLCSLLLGGATAAKVYQQRSE